MNAVFVKVGDVVRLKGTDKLYKCTRVSSHSWYTFNGNGNEVSLTNPLSSIFELSKNTIVTNILKDL